MAVPTVSNGNFESPAYAPGAYGSPAGYGWSWSGTAGISSPFGLMTSQYLYTSVGGAASQTIACDGSPIRLKLTALRRFAASATLTVTLGGVTILTAALTEAPVVYTSATITPTGSLPLVVSSNVSQANVDDIVFEAVATAISLDAPGGLAIGGDWPASLAIARPAPGGVEIGPGQGLDPSTTRVEAGEGGIEVGGEWADAAAVAEEALAGLAIGGEWSASAGWAGPATLRAAIHARLLASTALAAVVGPRVHHGRVPQRGEWPTVVFHAPAREYGRNLGGGDGTSSATVQVDCWATTAAQAEAAAEAVRLAFQGFRGRVGSVEFTGVFVDDVGETIERDAPGSDVWNYRYIITLEARHRVSNPPPEG